MNRALTIAFLSATVLAWTTGPLANAQLRIPGIPPQLSSPAGQTEATVYYDAEATRAIQHSPSAVHYDAGPGCAPLLPTIAEGLRNTLNCLLPCRATGGLGLGGPLLGNRRGGGLFSVRFYESCGCGLPTPRCGCGIQFLEGGPGVPVPAGDIPQVNPPKPVPDASAYNFRRQSQQLAVPAVYHPGQLRQISRPSVPTSFHRTTTGGQVRQASHYRVSPIPNPLRP